MEMFTKLFELLMGSVTQWSRLISHSWRKRTERTRLMKLEFLPL